MMITPIVDRYTLALLDEMYVGKQRLSNKQLGCFYEFHIGKEFFSKNVISNSTI